MTLERRLLRPLAALVGIGVLVWTVVWLGPRRILDAALEANGWWLAASLLPIVARFLIWGVKWRRMLRRERDVPLAPVLRIMMAGTFVNLTTPTAKLAGGVLRAVLLHRRFGWRRSAAYGETVADQVTNALGFLLLFGVLAAGPAALWSEGTGRIGFFVSGVVALAVVVAAAVVREPLWRRFQGPGLADAFARLIPRRWRREDHEAETALRVRLIVRPLLHGGRGFFDGFGSDVVLAAISFGALCVANATVLRALGADAPLWAVSVAVVLGYSLGTGLNPLGGVGMTEAALMAVYVKLGIAADVAAAGALLHRAGYYAIALGWGGVALLREGGQQSTLTPPD